MASHAAREEQPFVCRCCGKVLTLRRGGVRAAHFAHQPPVTCEYGAGESEAHRRCKAALFELLSAHPDVSGCEMERSVGNVRPDLSFYLRGAPVAVEVQLSSLTVEKIRGRTAEYARRNVYVLWLPAYDGALGRQLYHPEPWELWLQQLYGGRVYYWVGGLHVRPVHFRDYYAAVRGRTGEHVRRLPRKVPIDGERVTLTEDFAPSVRRADARAGVPDSKVFADRQPAWYQWPPRRVRAA